jgi:hypothetical protein
MRFEIFFHQIIKITSSALENHLPIVIARMIARCATIAMEKNQTVLAQVNSFAFLYIENKCC